MQRLSTIIFVLIVAFSLSAQEKEEGDYIQFDDRKNTVHGVYFGLAQHFGKVKNEWSSLTSLKLAYVANRKLEIGLEGTFFFSVQPNEIPTFKGDEVLLFGSYGGLHLEPILFGNRFISVSFPVLIGGGVITVLEEKEGGNGFNFNTDDYDVESYFIAEPGINLLYNISRFVQLETGVKYRFSSEYNLPLYGKGNMNGFSAGLGLKVGIFNMGRKKKVKDNFK